MHNRLFPEKVIKYLWDDAFKFNQRLFLIRMVWTTLKKLSARLYSTGHDRFKFSNRLSVILSILHSNSNVENK